MRHLDPSNLKNLNEILSPCLKSRKIVRADTFESGNMNLALRLYLDDEKTIFCKQGRPWVEKFPSVAAPVGRTSFEGWFFETLANTSVEINSPAVLDNIKKDQILLLSDLGSTHDGIELYKNARKQDFIAPLEYLSKLHSIDTPALDPPYKNNLAMRELNAFHMYEFPFTEPGYDFVAENLPALKGIHAQATQAALQNETTNKIRELYVRPCKGKKALLHGDFYPGSWIYDQQNHFYCIDPEFGFVGPREFDLGVFLAHANFCGIDVNSEEFLSPYLSVHSGVKIKDTYHFAGLETLRRLYGLAQLPLSASHKQKEAWTRQAMEWVQR